MGEQFLTPQTPRRKSRYAILINQSTNQPPLWGANTYIFVGKLWPCFRHQGLRASSVSLPSSHCKLCLLVLLLRMQMHFKANRVTEKRGEAAEGWKRRLSLTKRDEDAGLV